MSQNRTLRQPLLSTREAAELLGLSPRTLEAARLRGGGGGGLRYVKLGRSVRYRPEDLEAWIEAGLRTSTSDPGPSEDA